jgi:hypothetical protein
MDHTKRGNSCDDGDADEATTGILTGSRAGSSFANETAISEADRLNFSNTIFIFFAASRYIAGCYRPR